MFLLIKGFDYNHYSGGEMTRSEARLIAEELYNLIGKNMKTYISECIKYNSDEYLNTEEASTMIGISVKTLRRRKDEFPHVKIGKRIMFSKNGIIELMNR